MKEDGADDERNRMAAVAAKEKRQEVEKTEKKFAKQTASAAGLNGRAL